MVTSVSGAPVPIGEARSEGASVLWTALVPFFNEYALLPHTIASLAAQTVPLEIILVDNGSTDGSAEVARNACETLNLSYTLIVEPRSGKVSALAAGVAAVTTPFVAICDADTWYPRSYLAHATGLLAQPGCVAAGAFFVSRSASPARRLLEGLHVLAAGALLPGQCHAGGAGQAFETAALRRAGSFDPARWDWVLEDHEIIHRVLKHGRMAYGLNFWSAPSTRKRDRASVVWTVFERAVYHALGGLFGEWFFHDFLAPRLSRRSLSSARLRERAHIAGIG